MTFPTSATFLWAEDVRQEQGNKFTILGALLGDSATFSSDAPEDGKLTAKFAFLVTFRDGDGAWQGEWSITDEDGEVISHSTEPFPTAKKPNTNHTILVRALIKFRRWGRAKLVVKLDDHAYEYHFRTDRAAE